MKPTPAQIVALVLGAMTYLAALYAIHRALPERPRVWFRYVAAIATIGLFFLGLQRFLPEHARAVDVAKMMIAVTAAGCVFYETHRAGQRRPVAERWKKFVGVVLGVAAITAYFNGFRFGYPKYYHRWDQYHYYMGAKYFRELGYANLYRCSLIAQDDLGVVTYSPEAADRKLSFDLSKLELSYKYPDTGRTLRVDMKKEVRHPDKKIRNLGGDNLLMAAGPVLDEPALCKDGFTPERWEKYKADVQFFRIAADKGYWEDMQKDHGYNPPPVWTIMGRAFGELAPASTGYLQFLASLDIFYLLGMFGALWWAFGWRVFAVGAIFWGCQASAPFYWTGGAFLRQDWLFFLVLSMCCIRKKHFKIAGAAVVYAGLLRIFPGLVVIAMLTLAGIYLVRHKRMARHHAQVLLGGVLAAAVLIPVSMGVAGTSSYKQFYDHTIKVHDQTPLTNHMGLRVMVAHKPGTGVESGRMKYTKNPSLVDPFEVWKRMRNERYAKYKWAAYAVVAGTFALMVLVLRRVRSLWVAGCLGQIWLILLAQLTCYYYSFMILCAPLARVRPKIQAPLFGLAALSQAVWLGFYWNDDKYTALTAISLVFCYGLIFAFVPTSVWQKLAARFRDEPQPKAPGAAAGGA